MHVIYAFSRPPAYRERRPAVKPVEFDGFKKEARHLVPPYQRLC